MVLLVTGSRHRLQDLLSSPVELCSKVVQAGREDWEDGVEPLVEITLTDPVLQLLILRQSLSQTGEVVPEKNYILFF